MVCSAVYGVSPLTHRHFSYEDRLLGLEKGGFRSDQEGLTERFVNSRANSCLYPILARTASSPSPSEPRTDWTSARASLRPFSEDLVIGGLKLEREEMEKLQQEVKRRDKEADRLLLARDKVEAKVGAYRRQSVNLPAIKHDYCPLG